MLPTAFKVYRVNGSVVFKDLGFYILVIVIKISVVTVVEYLIVMSESVTVQFKSTLLLLS
jgi:hypothetical protein